jgi:predicted RNA polymerase sigma factor
MSLEANHTPTAADTRNSRRLQGAATALDLIDELDLDNYPRFHATRADLLRRLNRNSEAAAAYERAAAMASTDAERESTRMPARVVCDVELGQPAA